MNVEDSGKRGGEEDEKKKYLCVEGLGIEQRPDSCRSVQANVQD